MSAEQKFARRKFDCLASALVILMGWELLIALKNCVDLTKNDQKTRSHLRPRAAVAAALHAKT